MKNYDRVVEDLRQKFSVVGHIDLNQCFLNGQVDLTNAVRVKKQLEELHKDVFEQHERIIVRYDIDYNNDILKQFQSVVAEVDISNFFITIVTGKKDIDKVIPQLVTDSPFDKVPFQYVITDDKFTKLTGKNDIKKTYRYNSVEPNKISLDELDDREKFLLTESKTFCMYPWTHLHAYPTGDVQPCCHAEHRAGNFGNCQENTLKEIWNSDKMKQLRVDMLNEKENSACTRCYELETSGFFSGRRSANKHWGHHISKIKDTVDDGAHHNFQLPYWDIRFSNLCNLSCRSCGHIFSSSWYKDQKELAGPEWAKKNKALFWAGRHETDMFEQLMEHIDYVEQIYFAGGEPLIMDEHYALLEELEKRKRFDVKLIYNTNFTKTKLKDRYVFDYWKKFDSVAVGASLDAMGPRAEYIRKGTVWADVEENRQMMIEQCPRVDFYISCTLSIQNALHITDFHSDWVERGLIKPQDFNVNMLQDPEWMRIDIAPEHYKKKIRTKYLKHLEWLRSCDKLNRATVGSESALNYLENDNTKYLPEFWERMGKLDKLRNENMLEAIPELNELTK